MEWRQGPGMVLIKPMITKQSSLAADIIATRLGDGEIAAKGPPLVARRGEPSWSDAADLSNVVPLVRGRRLAAIPAMPLPTVGDRRSAPPAAGAATGWAFVLLAASTLLHGAVLAIFWQAPQPLTSVGIEAMTVEITLGATTAAGLAQQPGEQELLATSPPREDAPGETTEEAQLATVMPQAVPVATRDAAPETKPPEETPPEPQLAEPASPDQRMAPEAALVEAPPEPPVQAVETARERTRVLAPTDAAAPPKQSAATPPADAASGIGRGRSDESVNYHGRVAAHLARFKQYPAAARSAGTQGVATVSFSIDGSGRVTAARLTNGSGNAAIDQEVVAMVRRASPFPRPPDGQGRNFTVPVRFNLR